MTLEKLGTDVDLAFNLVVGEGKSTFCASRESTRIAETPPPSYLASGRSRLPFAMAD